MDDDNDTHWSWRHRTFAVAEPQPSTPSKPITDPMPSHDTDSDSTLGSEYERYCNNVEIDDDMANIQTSNKGLRTRDAVTQFFKKVEGISSLKDSETREWIGSLPGRMTREAIPLFEDDTGAGYQIHLSYSWLNALHTYSYKGSSHASDSQYGVPDYYVHSLFRTTNGINWESLLGLHTVIPLGKLFTNKSDRSEWTGYEVLITASLELWVVYVLDDIGFERWGPVECKLLPWESPDEARDGQAKTSPCIKIALLWDSLSTLESAKFNIAAGKVQSSPFQSCGGSFYLSEISKFEVSEAMKFPEYSYDVILKTSKLHVNVNSTAGCQLLSLIVEHVSSPIAMLTLRKQDLYKVKPGQRLLALAAELGDDPIVELILRQDKANAAVENEMHYTPLLSAIQAHHKGTVELLLNEDNIDKPNSNGIRPLLMAVESRDHEIVHLLLESNKIDVNAEDNLRRTPLTLAIEMRNSEAFEFLFKNESIKYDKPGVDGRTPLYFACRNGDDTMVHRLLRTRLVDPRRADDFGNTPLTISWKLREDLKEMMKHYDPTKPELLVLPLPGLVRSGHSANDEAVEKVRRLNKAL